jgi:hypothetical protein
MSTIIVKPTSVESVQRRHLMPVRIGVNPGQPGIDTGKVTGLNKATGATDRLTFVGDREKAVFKTGLLEMVTNPFSKVTVDELRGRYLLPNTWTDELLKKVSEAEQISRQTEFEILDGVDYNFYTSSMPRDMMGSSVMPMTAKRDKSFIEAFSVTLVAGANTFTTDTSRGRFAIQLFRNHPEVAPDLQSVNTSTHRWVVAQENEEVIEVVASNRLENKAVSLLTRLEEKHPEFALYRTAVILNLVRGETARSVVEAQLNGHIKSRGNDKGARVSSFIEAADMFFNNEERFNLLYYVQQAQNLNLIYGEGGYIFWGQMKETPERYKWPSKAALIAFLETEMKKYNPKEPSSADNAFGLLFTSLKERGIKLK